MEEVDPSDLNLADGKLYAARMTGLSDNVSWKARVVTLNQQGCSSSTPFINAPAVSVNDLDLAIYANNISFSNENPNENEVITLFARIRNLSGFPAESFVVSAYDGDIQIHTSEIPFLAPNSFVDISWQHSFPEPGFYPIKVVIDESDVVAEINELNNFAIRPVLVGNYVLPGGIEASAAPNTQTIYVNSWLTISGTGNYYGIDEGINPSVAGANVTIAYENDSFETTTGSGGNFSRSVLMPSVPGVYTFNVSVTDYTLTGHAAPFQVNVVPYPEKPDLISSLTLNQTEILTGGLVSGVATVTNSGDLAAGAFTFRVSNCEGTIDEFVVSGLDPGESRQITFETSVSQTGSCFNINNCTFYASADVGNVVDEKTKWNNTVSRSLTVYPPKPDLTASRSLIASSSTMDAPFVFTVKVDNIGGVEAVGPFDVRVYVDDVLVHTQKVEILASCDQFSYPVEVTFASLDNHVIRVKVDEPLGSGSVAEYNEDNNEFVRTVKYSPPPALRPNLNVRIQDLTVSPGLPMVGESFEIKATVRNNGSAPITGPVDVRFTVTADGVESVENVTLPDGLANGSAGSVNLFTSLPNDGNHQVLVELDPFNLVSESSEYDNKAQMPLCVDFTPSQSGSVWSGGFFVDTPQNLTGRVRNLGLFTATGVRVTFLLDNVEIGSTVIQEVGPTYSTTGYPVSIPYTFREAGLFELKMVVDRPDDYVECHEDNNVTAATIRVRAPQPDLRIVSEYISPTNLNPEMNEEVNLFVSFENIGVAAAQAFSVRVLVDDQTLGEDIRIDGLAAGQLTTVPVGVPYSSGTAGIKVVRGIVDVLLETDDVNYNNNEASRAIVVGEAPNLLFAGISFSSDCVKGGDMVEIMVDIVNEGDMAADAEVHFYYVTETDTIPIDFVPVSVDLQSSLSTSIFWTVVNPEYGIYAEIRNSTPVEYNDLDNSISAVFEDTTPPVVVVRNITVYLDENGMAEITPEDVDNGSFDECGIAGMTLDNNTFDCIAAGFIAQVTLTVTDFSGNSASAIAEMQVLDSLPPVISGIPEDIEVSNDPDKCGAIVEWTVPTVDDNCDISSFEQSAGPENGSLFPVGDTMVEYAATDTSGNTTTASFTVTVNDTQVPVISGMPEDIVVNNDAGLCSANVTWDAPSAADNCDVDSFASNWDPGDAFPVGTTIVTYTATDIHGNKQTASFEVVVTDSELPVINGMPEDIAVNNDADLCSAIVTWDAPSAADNCDVESFGSDWDPGDAFPVGTTIVTYTATDIHGNKQTASFEVVVTDSDLPVINGMPEDIVVNNDAGLCSAIVTWDAPFAADNCEVDSFTSNWEPGDAFPVGTTIVTYTAEDVHGNVHTASFEVVVTDSELPVINGIPEEFAVNNDAGLCSAIVTWDAPFAADNCDVESFGSDWDPGDAFPVGTTTVTYTAEDVHGNVHTASFNVVVKDNELPVINGMPEDIVVSIDADSDGAIVTWDEPTVSDNCGGYSLELTSGLESGSLFQVGNTVVVYTATDAAGNTTTAGFTVAVIDSQAPEITGLPEFIEVNNDPDACGAIVTWDEPTTSHIYEVISLEQTAGPASGSIFPIGITAVSYTAEDINGNIATGSFTVTVTDAESPVVLIRNITLQLNQGESVTISPADLDNGSYDLCGPVTLSISKETFTETDEGEIEVVLTVTDKSENSASSTALVTVVVNRDAACQAVAIGRDLTLQLDKNGIASLNARDVNNGSYSSCKGKLELSVSKSAFTCEDLGDNIVILTVTDPQGFSSSVPFTVTVIDLLVPVIINAPKRISVTIAPDESYTLPDLRGLYVATDNCVITEYLQYPEAGTVWNQPGNYLLTLKAVDSSGNITLAEITVALSVSQPKGGGPGKKSAEITDHNIGENGKVTLWPNPTRGRVYIGMPEKVATGVLIEVYSVSGNLVYSQKYPPGDQVSFNLSDKVSGLYLVLVHFNNHTITEKIILTD
jgi:subtilase family serine protease